MILYTLKCRKDHEFDAWFRDSALYEQQVAAGAVRCPVCGSKKIEKALMAPRVAAGRSRGHAKERSEGHPRGQADAVPAALAAGSNEEAVKLRNALLELRQTIEETCDYVGPEFAEEARKIHYGEIKQRAIYGETTAHDAEALSEEGIAVQQIPWIPRGES